MRVCPKCGFRDIPLWRYSRFDFNAEYMRFDEAMAVEELRIVCLKLLNRGNFEPVEHGGYVYYRRGKGGMYLYRVLKEDFRVPRERKRHG